MKGKLLTSLCLTGMILLSNNHASATNDLPTIATTYLNTPYYYGGTTPKGFDCSGYVQYVFKQYGMDIPRTSRQQAIVGVEVPKEDLQIGDILYFKETASSAVSHSGIYLGDNKFISSTTSSGVRIDDLTTSKYWKDRLAGARRVLTEPIVANN